MKFDRVLLCERVLVKNNYYHLTACIIFLEMPRHFCFRRLFLHLFALNAKRQHSICQS